MGGAISPYRVLGERPLAEALQPLPVVQARALASLENATSDDEDFATVRYVAGGDDGAVDKGLGAKTLPLWFYLVGGFTTAFGSLAAWAMFGGR